MTDAVQIALIVAAGPIVLGVLSEIRAYRSNRKLDHITFLTNSTMTKAMEKMEEQRLQIERLEGVVVKLLQEKVITSGG